MHVSLSSPPGNPQAGELKKLSVLLPASLHYRAKRHCLDADITLTELVIRLLETHLNEQESPP